MHSFVRLAFLPLLLLTARAQTTESQQPAQAVDPARARAPLASVPSIAPSSRPSAGSPLDAAEVREHYRAAQSAMKAREYERVVARINSALEATGEDFYELHNLLAWAKFHQGRFGEARAAAERAAAIHPGAADVHYLLGKLYERQNQTDRAIEQFRTTTLAYEHEIDNPHVTAAWFKLGEALEQAGYFLAAAESYARFDEAIWETHTEQQGSEIIKPILARYPSGLAESRINLLKRIGLNDEAVRAAELALRARPDDVALVRLHVRTLVDAGRHQEALAKCRARFSDETTRAGFIPVAVEAAVKGGLLTDWLGRLRSEFEPAERLQIMKMVARQLEGAGDYPKAAALWRDILAEKPQDAETVWSLAGALKSAGDLRQALQTLIEFVRDRPDSTDLPIEQLTGWMRRFERVDEFLKLVGEFESAAGRDFASDFVLGSMAAAAGQHPLAEKLFTRALEGKPDLVLARLAWAQMLLATYRWDEAKTQSREALKLAPELPAGHYCMAQAHSGLDENEDAEASFKAAVRLARQGATYAMALARQYQRMAGESEDPILANEHLLAAQRYFQQAFDLDRRNPEALEGVIDSYVGGGKVEIAEAQLAAAQEAGLPEDVLLRQRLTTRHARAPFTPEHFADMRAHVARFPNDLITAMKLAAGLYLKRQQEEAHRVATQVFRQAPDDERAVALLARITTRQLEYEEAIRLLEDLLRRYPNRRSVLGVLAETLRWDFRQADARKHYERLIELEKDGPIADEARAAILSTYLEVRDFDGALNYVDEWQTAEPSNPGITAEKTRVLLLARRDGDALDLAEKWLEERPGDPVRRETYARLAELGLTQATPETCARIEKRLRAWIDEQPANPMLTLQLGSLLARVQLAANQPDQALKTLNSVQVVEPFVPMITAQRAQCEATLGRIDAAVAELNSLLDDRAVQDNRREAVRAEIVALLAKHKEYDRALKLIDQWLADQRELGARFDLLNMKQSILQAARRTDEYVEVAESLLQLGATLEPMLAGTPEGVGLASRLMGVNNDLGYTWVDAGRNLDRATKMIRSAVADSPMNSAFLDSLGWAYYKTGDFAAARKWLSRSIQTLGGEDATVYDHLGDAEFRLGDSEAARRSWTRAVELITDEMEKSPARDEAALLAAVRGKLDALRAGQKPRIAATASEGAP